VLAPHQLCRIPTGQICNSCRCSDSLALNHIFAEHKDDDSRLKLLDHGKLRAHALLMVSRRHRYANPLLSIVNAESSVPLVQQSCSSIACSNRLYRCNSCPQLYRRSIPGFQIVDTHTALELTITSKTYENVVVPQNCTSWNNSNFTIFQTFKHYMHKPLSFDITTMKH